jgi:hypothetical protein
VVVLDSSGSGVEPVSSARSANGQQGVVVVVDVLLVDPSEVVEVDVEVDVEVLVDVLGAPHSLATWTHFINETDQTNLHFPEHSGATISGSVVVPVVLLTDASGALRRVDIRTSAKRSPVPACCHTISQGEFGSLLLTSRRLPAMTRAQRWLSLLMLTLVRQIPLIIARRMVHVGSGSTKIAIRALADSGVITR